MDWLLHNFIADMPGPSFVGAFAGVAVMVLAACYLAIRRRDPTKLLAPPEVPSKVDPYEIAYLRGGANEVVRVVVYALRQRGFIAVRTENIGFMHTSTTTKLGQRRDPPDEQLTGLEARVFDSVRRPKEASDLFDTRWKHFDWTKRSLTDDIEQLCSPYRTRLLADNLLLPAPTKQEKLRVFLLGAGTLVGLATYKVASAWYKGLSNIAFPVPMTVVAILILTVAVGASDHKISARGKAYLARLRLAFGGLGTSVSSGTSNAFQPDHAAVLAVGVSGLAILKGTPDAAFAEFFPKAGSRGGCGSNPGD